MKRLARLIWVGVVAVATAIGTATAAPGVKIPWKMETYTLVAREMNLRTALETFAVSQGLSVVLSDKVNGFFSGDFKNMPPQEFLEKVATLHNLTWYYDGAALYFYVSGEIQTLLLDLQYMKANEVRSMLADLCVEDVRFPIKTTSNEELIMVSGPPRYVTLISELIAKADKLRELRTFNEVETRLFPLKNTWADDVSFKVSSPESSMTLKGMARILEELMSSGGNNGKARDAETNGTDNVLTPIEQTMTSAFRPIIRPENRLNAVLIRDVSSRMPMYEKLIAQLDLPQKLIEIGVTVVELSKKDALDWQLSLKVTGERGEFAGGVGQNANTLFAVPDMASKGLAGALTYLGKDVNVAASLTSLREQGKARSISRTSLLTANNFAAQLTDMQSYHARVVGTEVATLEEVTAGTKLQIKPRIVTSPATNVPNQVWLSLELDDGGFESVTVDAMPMTRSSMLQTQTAVFEDESIMLAGYFRDIEEKAGWGIPYLRDIPWIGWLFGGSSTKRETVQRMFILTPHIVDLDAEMLARLQATRLRDITEAEQMEEDAAVSDDERKERELNRKEVRRRREEDTADRMRRREAEINRDRKLRQVDRKFMREQLESDKREWRHELRQKQEEMEAALKKPIPQPLEKEGGGDTPVDDADVYVLPAPVVDGADAQKPVPPAPVVDGVDAQKPVPPVPAVDGAEAQKPVPPAPVVDDADAQKRVSPVLLDGADAPAVKKDAEGNGNDGGLAPLLNDEAEKAPKKD
ncbi:MAG: type III secretion system outer membrane ring subunit SctC [Kiritimatiellae bacterium]|nr:type III secretion system outer membrane ring subunit SctC [Kiritimatiellia bacterium]